VLSMTYTKIHREHGFTSLIPGISRRMSKSLRLDEKIVETIHSFETLHSQFPRFALAQGS